MRRKWRIVVDTSVLISAAISPQGSPRRALVYAARSGTLLSSEATLEEFASLLRRAKFDPYLSRKHREAFVAWYSLQTVPVEVTERIRACRDPKDDKFLELALSGAADVMISSDKDLTTLHPFRGIPILKPAAFLESAFARG